MTGVSRFMGVVCLGLLLLTGAACVPDANEGEPEPTAPFPPMGLSARPAASEVLLEWQPNAETNLAGYQVYAKAENTDAFSPRTASPLDTLRFSDTLGELGVEQEYYITAVNQEGLESIQSETVSAIPGSIHLELPVQNILPGATARIPLAAANAAGIAPGEMLLEVRFDPALLAADSIQVQRTAITRYTQVTQSLPESGLLRIEAAGDTEELRGEGALFDIYVRALDAALNEAGDLSFGQVELAAASGNTLSIDKGDRGQVIVAEAGYPGDVDEDGQVSTDDVEALLELAAGLQEVSQEQLRRADLNADGRIDSADAVLAARIRDGRSLNPTQEFDRTLSDALENTAQVDLALVGSGAKAAPGDTVQLSVSLSSVEAVAGLQLSIAFNAAQLRFAGAAASGPFAGAAVYHRESDTGLVHVGLVLAEGIQAVGSALAANLQFEVREDASPGAALPVTLNGALIAGAYGGRASWYAEVRRTGTAITLEGGANEGEGSADEGEDGTDTEGESNPGTEGEPGGGEGEPATPGEASLLWSTDAEEVSTLQGFAISPDGTRIATFEFGGNLEIWDFSSGALLSTHQLHQGNIEVAQYTPDGASLLTGADDQMVIRWNAETLEEEMEYVHDGAVTAMDISSDGTRLLTSSHVSGLSVWDIASGEFLASPPGGEGDRSRVDFAPDGIHALVTDYRVRQWIPHRGLVIGEMADHEDDVNMAVYAADGSIVFTISDDETARLWDARNGKELQRFEGHTDRLLSGAIAPDGSIAATSAYDGTTRIWNPATGEELHELPRQAELLAFGPNGRYLLIYHRGADDLLELYDTGGLDSQALSFESEGLPEPVTIDAKPAIVEYGVQYLPEFVFSQAVFDPMGNVVQMKGRTLRAADSQSNVILGALEGVEARNIALSPDGGKIMLGLGRDPGMYDVGMGEVVHRIDQFNTGREDVDALAFSHDARLMATGDADGLASLWNVFTGDLHYALEGHTGEVTGVAFSPDGLRVYTASLDGDARVWNAVDGSGIGVFSGHASSIQSLALSSDGAMLATVSELPEPIAILWDTGAREEIRRFEGHATNVISAAFSPDDAQLATGALDGEVRVWDVDTGALLFTLEDASLEKSAHEGPVVHVEYSPGGAKILTTNGTTGLYKVWDAGTGELLNAAPAVEAHSDGVSDAVISPDGELAATASEDDTIKIWNAKTGGLLHTLTGHTDDVEGVAFSPDGQTLASGSQDGTLRLWNPATGEERQSWTLLETGTVYKMAYTPDGAAILCGTSADEARLINPETGALIRSYGGHGFNVYAVAVSGDGTQLITGSGDNAAKIFNLDTGEEIRTLDDHNDDVVAVAFAASGNFVLTGSASDRARMWDAATGLELREFGNNNARAVGLSNDDSLVAYSTQYETSVVYAATGNAILATSLGDNYHPSSIYFSADDRYIITGSNDGTGVLFEIPGEETSAEQRRPLAPIRRFP